MSNFSFVDEDILRSNLNQASDHVVKLVSLSLSKEYKNQLVLVSGLRKTIIIHTAAIVEALLLWKLKFFYKYTKVEMPNEWKYFDIKSIHSISSSEEVIAGKRKKESKEFDKLDFNRIIDLCKENKIIVSERLESDLDKLRVFRNKLHIGGLREIEKEYNVTDLEFCFSVQERIIKLVSKKNKMLY